MKLKSEQKVELLRYMLLNRLVEERLSILYRQGKVLGGLYLSRGQEAISVGTAYALGPDDVVGPMIRNMGALFVRGMEPRDVFLQYLGRAESPTGGRENAHHIGDLHGKGVVAPISMLGKMISILMGISMSFKLRGEKRVAMNYIGEGGASAGDFHEALNMAGVFKLPFILIVENNQYAYSTPVTRQTDRKAYLRQGRRLRHPRRAGRRQRRAGGLEGDSRSRREGAGRQGAVATGVHDDAHAGPRGARRRALRAGTAFRGMEEARPDRELQSRAGGGRYPHCGGDRERG